MIILRIKSKLRIALLILVALILMSLILIVVLQQSTKSVFVHNEKYEGVILRSFSKWNPDSKTIEEFENGLAAYLTTQSKGSIDNQDKFEFILANLEKYKRRYTGTIKEGQQVLECRFIEISENDNDYWKKVPVNSWREVPIAFELFFNLSKKEYLQESIEPIFVHDEKYEGVILRSFSKWNPDSKTIEEFEKGVAAYLTTQSKGSRDKQYILANLKKYKRQYIGTIKDGQQVLECQFITISEKDDTWKDAPLIIYDGGADYFELSYNISKKEYFDLYVHGHA